MLGRVGTGNRQRSKLIRSLIERAGQKPRLGQEKNWAPAAGGVAARRTRCMPARHRWRGSHRRLRTEGLPSGCFFVVTTLVRCGSCTKQRSVGERATTGGYGSGAAASLLPLHSSSLALAARAVSPSFKTSTTDMRALQWTGGWGEDVVERQRAGRHVAAARQHHSSAQKHARSANASEERRGTQRRGMHAAERQHSAACSPALQQLLHKGLQLADGDVGHDHHVRNVALACQLRTGRNGAARRW